MSDLLNETIRSLQAELLTLQTSIQTKYQEDAESINSFFNIYCGMFVLLMQAGFALLEAGCVRSKNTTNILLTNFIDTALGALSYWAFGYALAYGGLSCMFTGYSNFFLIGTDEGSGIYGFWFFQFVFASTAATIVSGAVAERCSFITYVGYTLVLTGIAYPIGSHWAWSTTGTNWLGKNGFHDFAGSCVVHVLGGTAALVGSVMLGPRTGRFDSGTDALNLIPGHSTTLVAIGGFLLWIGFVAFNGGSNGVIVGAQNHENVSLVVINTMLSSSAAGCVALTLNWLINKKWSLLMTINGILGGAVSICAGCDCVETWAAFVIGVIAGAVYLLWSWITVKLRIDDPVEAVAVHLGCGIWGALATGIFATSELNAGLTKGIFMDGSFTCFAWNLLGVIVYMAWAALCMGTLCFVLKILKKLRVTEELELLGLDAAYHDEPAYPENKLQENLLNNNNKLLYSLTQTSAITQCDNMYPVTNSPNPLQKKKNIICNQDYRDTDVISINAV